MTNKPRIIYVVHDFLPEVTAGTELHTLWLAEELSKNYEIFIFTRTYDRSLEEYATRDEEFQGLRIRRVKFANKDWVHPADFYSNSRIGEIFANYINEIRPALIHIHHTVGLSATILEIAAARHIPTILQLRDFHYMCQRVHLLDASGRLCNGPMVGVKCADCIQADSNPYIPKDLSSLYSRLIFEQGGVDRAEYMRTLLLLPDLVICPSEFLKTKFAEFGIPASRIRVSPEGIKVEGFQSQRDERKDEKIVFGYLGNIAYQKGLHILISAFANLDQARAELKIYGGGDSPLIEKLRAESQSLSVEFMGGYSHDQLPKILSNLDVVVHPSLCNESYSIVIREALAAKVPVIVSDIPAQRDAVRDGIDGLHFHVGDRVDLSRKMNLLIENPNTLLELKANIPQVRTVSDQAREFAEIYEDFIHSEDRESSKREILAKLKMIRERNISRPLLMQLSRVVEELRNRSTDLCRLESRLSELESEKERLRSEIVDRDSKLAMLESRLSELESRLSVLESEKQSLQSEISVIRSSLGYRFMRFYASVIDRMFPEGTRRGEFRKIVTASLHIIVEEGFESFRRQAIEKIRRREFRILQPPTAFPSSLDPYLQWLERDRITKRVFTLMKSHIESFSVKPKFSILMPVFNPSVKFLCDAIDSVLAQVYERYELCICDNGSNAEVKSVLRSYEKADSRIKICTNPTNLGISEGLNEALKIATGEFIGILDHDDVLDRAALYYVARVLNDNPQLDVIYTDRDHMDENGVRLDPYFKPDWSPHTILSHNYVIHLLVVRANLLKDLGGFRKEFDGSQDYDLILRLSEKTTHIAHIPRVLYSWRRHRGSSSVTPRMIAYENAQKAISEALHRRGAEATVTRDTPIGPYRWFHKIKGKPLVSIIISSFDVEPYLEKCISSIVEKSTYSNYEIIVATNNPNPSSLRDFCCKNNIRLLPCGENSFYSHMNNQAADSAQGDFLVFLNDDIVVETPSWIEEMLQLCQLPEVGAVGPMQIRPNGDIQFTSSVSQLTMEREFYHFSPHAFFQMAHLFGFSSKVISNVSSLSGSCMMIKRQLFMSLGGFDSDTFALSFQDVDLCYRLLDLGLYNVYTPYAVLTHLGAGSKRLRPDYDSATGVLGHDLEVARRFCKKYQKRLLAGDQFFNKNLCGPRALLSPRPLLVYEEVGDQYDSSYWTSYGFPLMRKGEAIATRESRVKGVCKLFAKSILKATGCKTVIDIGCGLAEFVEAFQDLGTHAVGVELSSVALALIPEKIRSHILSCSITDASIASLLAERGEKRFDIALALELLEHIPETKIDLAIANIRGLADTVIVTTPKPNLWDNEDPTHLCIRPTSFWINRFSAAGFEADEILRSKIFGANDLEENEDCTRVVFKRKR